MTSRSMILFGTCLLLSAACSGTDPPDEPSSSLPLFLTDECLDLDRYSCEVRADCVADFCFLCSCTRQFQGCRSAIARPLACPLLDCAQPDCCRSSADCPFPEDVCAPPATARICPACSAEVSDCQVDADCQFWEICEPLLCSCTGAGRCVRGCTAHRDWCDPEGCGVPGHCEPGYHCSCTEHPRCLPEPCDTFEDCEIDHTCLEGECRRVSCETDDDCEGICVLGQCHPSFGECLSGAIP